MVHPTRLMAMTVLAMLVVALTACDKKGSGDGAEGSAKTEADAAENAAATTGDKKEAPAMQSADPAKDAKRLEHVEAEYAKVDPYPISNSLATLSAEEQAFVQALTVAAAEVDTLNALQINPKNPEWAKEIEAKGTKTDKLLYARYQMPWCVDDQDPLCSCHPDMPKKEIGWYHWPEGMTDEEFEAIKKAPNSKELMSPFTVVRRGDEKGTWVAIPYAKDPLFGPHMKKLSDALLEAAKHAPDESMATFLKSRAAALVADDPFPFDKSDYDWIALGGDWEVTVGPYEVYKNPKEVKARFELYFGKVNPEVTEALAVFKTDLQAMEKSLGALVGEDIYQGRTLDPRIAVRAVDVWVAAGDGKREQGVTAAFHLPNRGASVDEGLYKKVMIVNHMKAFEDIMKKRAALVLDPDQRQYVSSDDDILNTTFHEFSHGFGAHDELVITTKDGAKVTVHEALGEYTTLFEELKADTLGLYFVDYLVKKGTIDAEQAKKRYISALMHIFGLLQYNFQGVYPRMVAIQLGWYLDHGAVVYDEKTGFWKIDFDKMPGAVEALAKKAATIQLTGDKAAAKELNDKYVVTLPDGTFGQSALLEKPLAQVKERFKEAGVKSIAITYEVKKD